MRLIRITLLFILTAGYAALWIWGVASYLLWNGPLAERSWTASLFLILAASLALSLSPASCRLPLLAGGMLGLIAEVVGVRLGLPFGRYAYTQALGFAVLGVPVVMACAWLVLLAYVRQGLGWVKGHRRWRAFGGAAWMVGLDLLIDPLASGPMGLWLWREEGTYYGIPVQNFVGWFAVSLAFFLLFDGAQAPRASLAHLGFSLILFFTLLSLTCGLPGAGLVGLGLTLLHGWLYGPKSLSRLGRRSQAVDGRKAS